MPAIRGEFSVTRFQDQFPQIFPVRVTAVTLTPAPPSATAQRPPSPLAPLAPTPPAGLRYGLRRRSLVLALLGPDGNSGQSEAEVAAPERRRAPVAARRPAVGAEAAPAAAPDHPVRAHDGIRPFPDVAVKVVDSQAVRWIRAHFRGASQERPLGRAAGVT